jgi:two-component sensor histidine kinase
VKDMEDMTDVACWIRRPRFMFGTCITVAYDVAGTDWKLSVADNGMGKPDGVFAQPKSGLGTGIVKALAKQLDSQVVTSSGPKGTTVSVTHATFAGREERLEAVN